MGFSINMLTLFGIVLAIGIVVDDAIVVVEAVEKIMHDKGLAPREAAREAMRGHRRRDRRRHRGDLRGVRADRVPGRGHRHAVQAVRGHDHDLDAALGDHRAHAHAGAVRAHPEAGTRKPRPIRGVRPRRSSGLTGGYVGVVGVAIRRWLALPAGLRRADRGRPVPVQDDSRRASCPRRTRARCSSRSTCPRARRRSASRTCWSASRR